MDVLFCASEAYPLIKTGGLGDVSASLPRALRELGVQVRLILPAYPAALERAGVTSCIALLTLSGSPEPVRILKGRFPQSDITLYLVDSPTHFQRTGNPYVQHDGSDWPDNAQRFALFARAIAAVALGQADPGWKAELVHCNDWQTGLLPPLLSRLTTRPATLFTIHNLSYQGLFSADTFTTLQLPPDLWSIEGVEFHNQLSFIKGGIACADWLSTVSPSYAKEICTAEFGYGLEGLLRYRADRLTGILNGIDDETWNPDTDPLIEHNYSVHTLQRKALNKAVLQREHALPVNASSFLLGSVGRLVEQKGTDLILEILDQLLQHRVQLIVLGSGEKRFETRLVEAARRYPRQLAVNTHYDEALAHRIEAGADAFLMPSRFEPCGLNQMYSLRYGTIPIAHQTGGLADTVTDWNEASARDYSATGFAFKEDNPQAALDACLRALYCFQSTKVDWWKLTINGMKKDFSWSRSATRYLDLYRHVIELQGVDHAG